MNYLFRVTPYSIFRSEEFEISHAFTANSMAVIITNGMNENHIFLHGSGVTTSSQEQRRCTIRAPLQDHHQIRNSAEKIV